MSKHFEILCFFVDVGNTFSTCQLLGHIDELDCNIALLDPVFSEDHLAEATRAQDFSHLEVIQNCTVIEVFTCQTNVENVLVVEELNVLLSDFHALLGEETCFCISILATKVPTNLFKQIFK